LLVVSAQTTDVLAHSGARLERSGIAQLLL
jgi:hypothetical protein